MIKNETLDNTHKYLKDVYNRCFHDFVDQRDVLNNKIKDKTKKFGFFRMSLFDVYGIPDVQKRHLVTLGLVEIEGGISLMNNSIKWIAPEPTITNAENLLSLIYSERKTYTDRKKLDITSTLPTNKEISKLVDDGVLTKKEVTNLEKLVEKNVDTKKIETPEKKGEGISNREFLTTMEQKLLDSNAVLHELLVKTNERLERVEKNEILIINLIKDSILTIQGGGSLSDSDIKLLLENIETIKTDIKGLDMYDKAVEFANKLKKDK